jgi:aminoglycoside phosphotransferase (APT) family kinase protein
MSRPPDDIPAEVEVTEDLVRGLLEEQAAEWAHLPLTPLGQGWDNEMFRLGDTLAVRVPRRATGAGLLDNELRWLPELAPRLPAPIPAAVFAGRPRGDYPFRWAVVPYMEGRRLGDTVGVGARFARELGGFLATLHALELPGDPPQNPYRNQPLSDPRRASSVAAHLDALGEERDVGALRALWGRACAAPIPPRRAWCHGDVHPFNLIAHDGALAAVIDWGDMTAGDPAVDLAIAWVALDAGERVAFFDAYGPADDDLRLRARGWALVFALMFWDSARRGASGSFARVGERALAALTRSE